MKQDIYIVDATAEKGHVLFVKQICNILGSSFKINFLSSSAFAAKVAQKPSLAIHHKLFRRPSRYIFVLNQIIILLKSFKSIPKNSQIIITGFENISFSVVSRIFFFKQLSIYAYVHNNLDRNKLSLFFLSKTNRKVKFIVFEEFMKIDILNSFKLFVIPHPINIDYLESCKGNYFLGVNIDLSNKLIVNKVNKINQSSNKNFIIKKRDKTEVDGSLNANIKVFDFLEDYIEQITSCELLILDIEYNYRISGVAYEGLSLGKKILFLRESKLSNCLSEKFPKSCFSNYDEINFLELETDKNYFLKLHSKDNILRMWETILNEL